MGSCVSVTERIHARGCYGWRCPAGRQRTRLGEAETVGEAFLVPGGRVGRVKGALSALWISMQPSLMMGQAIERASRLQTRVGVERWAWVAKSQRSCRTRRE